MRAEPEEGGAGLFFTAADIKPHPGAAAVAAAFSAAGLAAAVAAAGLNALLGACGVYVQRIW